MERMTGIEPASPAWEAVGVCVIFNGFSRGYHAGYHISLCFCTHYLGYFYHIIVRQIGINVGGQGYV